MQCSLTNLRGPQLVLRRPCPRPAALRSVPSPPNARRCRLVTRASVAAVQADVRLPRWEDIHRYATAQQSPRPCCITGLCCSGSQQALKKTTLCRVLTVNENLQSVTPERAAELVEEHGFVRPTPSTSCHALPSECLLACNYFGCSAPSIKLFATSGSLPASLSNRCVAGPC